MLDANTIRDQLTDEDIIKLCTELQGDDTYLLDGQGNYIFNTCLDHATGDSFKLYYYPSSKMFYCYTSGDSYDIYEIVKRVKEFPDFISAFRFVVNYFKIVDSGFEEDPKVDDWDILNRVDQLEKRNAPVIKKPIKFINPNILEYYYSAAVPREWIKEGISAEIMKEYNIRIDTASHNIIIPHYDQDNNLIGIRRRTYDLCELERGKYTPAFIEGDMYNHPLGDYLYGLHKNKDTIKATKRVIVFEAEKSVLQLATFVGVDNCIGVATCGSSLSQNQIQLLLDLGVEEVIIAYDREFEGHRGDSDTVEYEKKLAKVMQPLVTYMQVYVIMDYDHLTNYKDSPTDRGYEIFKKLLHSKIAVTSENNIL